VAYLTLLGLLSMNKHHAQFWRYLFVPFSTSSNPFGAASKVGQFLPNTDGWHGPTSSPALD